MKIAFIGGGNMGEAIIGALLKKKLCNHVDISVNEIIEARRNYLKKKYHIVVTARTRGTVTGKDVIVLAVKPQNIGEALAGLKQEIKPEQLILSIAAGVTIKTINQGLGHDKVVRSMPNTPAQLGLGMTGWTATIAVTPEQRNMARQILGAMGKEIYFENEASLDAVTAVSGSGPAYFYLFTEYLISAAVELGLSVEDAATLAKQTVLGAARLMDESDKSVAELRRNVTSKGGTTEQAIRVFEESGLSKIVIEAVQAAFRRAGELGNASETK